VKFNWRTFVALLHDLVACSAAWLGAFWLRFNLEEIPAPYESVAIRSLIWIVPLYGVLFLIFGLYRGMWRFASLYDLKRIVSAVGIGAISVAAILFMAQVLVPRTVLVVAPLLLASAMGGSRLAYRAWKERALRSLVPTEREPVFVIGADDTAVSLIKALARSSQWHVVGVFDDDAANLGRELHGINILGHTDDLPLWAQKVAARYAILAMPAASHQVRRNLVQKCSQAKLQVLTVPSFDDLVSGRVTVSQIRHVELDDLLGRDPIVLDTAGLRNWLSDRVVLVTGAGGSIGSELCRQIARYAPRRLVLFELNEFALYSIEQEFREKYSGLDFVCVIGDVKSAARVRQVLETYRPSVIFHAAAYKHVPLMENENAWEAILNNVGGTKVTAEAAMEHAVEKFVLISTDKAVNPVNVMGASKRLAEMVCQAFQRPEDGTRFVIVRFGNVLGSTGSVIPKFREQIARGGPITVTHPEITRFFMSIPEAVQLVMQAGLMGGGGEIFVLDMGEPVRIADLARDMIRLSGLGEQDIRIEYTGLRPGEKLYEELLGANESTVSTPHPKLRIAKACQENGVRLEELSHWLATNDFPHEGAVKAQLARWVREYTRSSPGGNAG
jgi:FlaA1/EpsC-like NDP-sugar epimerase